MNILLKILQYLPYVLQGVSAIQQVAKNASNESKKAIIMDSVSTAAQLGQTVPQHDVQIISAVTDQAVQSLKSAYAPGFNPPGSSSNQSSDGSGTIAKALTEADLKVSQ